MVDERSMDDARFRMLLDAYGGDAARWPDAERASALRHLAATPGARPARGSAQALDAALNAWTVESPSAALRARVAGGLPAVRAPRARALWLSGAGLIAAGLVGLMVGAGLGRTSLAPAPAASDSDAAVAAALNSSTEFAPSVDEALI